MNARPTAWLVLLLGALSMSARAAGPHELGRLFLTPEERAALDRARHAQPAPLPPPVTPAPVLEEAEVDTAPAPPAIALTIDGYIRRSGGAPTVWINGAEATAEALAEVGISAQGLSLEQRAVRVPLARERAGVLLKPGQSFDPDSARVSDAYEHPPAP